MGHWEGDWHLTYSARDKVTPTKSQGMINWLNVRQRAIDDAKRDTKSNDVHLYQYTEVNLVQKGMKERSASSMTSCRTRQWTTCRIPATTRSIRTWATWQTLAGCARLHRIKTAAERGHSGKTSLHWGIRIPSGATKTPEKQDLYARDVCRQLWSGVVRSSFIGRCTATKSEAENTVDSGSLTTRIRNNHSTTHCTATIET